MKDWIFNQLEFARLQTIRAIEQQAEEELEIIPEGLNNHVKWNLGHIYVVTEKFAFTLTGEEATIPEHFHEWFASGTSPKEWTKKAPTKEELITLLKQQLERVQAQNEQRLNAPLPESYATSTGLQLSTVGESLSFCLYHEAMHYAAIKSIITLISSKWA
ncbi:DinB family protein [Paenibacillus sp. FSL W7-1287]|uniref:DinB family protein n=1 Tax=Paenibacillus sp. FSL W7-1287 TaxID=2954538 RepID=UPI0030FBCAA7